jgi:DNA polymerase I
MIKKYLPFRCFGSDNIVNLDPKKTVFLVDGSSFLYRGYYGLRPLHTSKGIPVQAVYSFCRMIKKLIDTFSMHYVVLVWDSKGKTTRHELYEHYKATRQAPPHDLFEQKKYVLQFADLISMCQRAQQGIEADDIIYSIGQEVKKEDFSVCIVSSDKDMSQMLDTQTTIFDPFKNMLLETQQFEQKRGFPVAKLPFYVAIVGDASDNIPGVKGIGEKGALELVTQFSSLQDLYENLSNVYRPKMQKLLQEHKAEAFLSEQLFTLQYYPSGLSINDMRFDISQWSKALPLFQELEFKSLVKDIEQNELLGSSLQAKIASLTVYDFKTVATHDELRRVKNSLLERNVFALDTETTGLNPLDSELVGISICYQEGLSFYIPCGHRVEGHQLSRYEVLSVLGPILEDPSYKKYMHNAKYDQLVLKHHGIEVRGLACDTLVAARLVAQDWQKLSLKQLSVHYFGQAMLSFAEVVKEHNYKNFSYVPLDLATSYAAADAHQTWRLKKILEAELRKEKLIELYETIEHPLIQVLYKMELEGIYCDITLLKDLDSKVTAQLNIIEQQIAGLVAETYKDINLNSPKQVEELLFHRLGLPPQKKSGTGRYSTDQEVLEILAPLHPVPGLILQYRELAKLKSTYIDALPSYVNPHTGRIHTSFSQTAVATGRLASSDPNLQNIPTGASIGSEIRAAFKPKAGHLFIAADYSQIELRVLAQVSQDNNLIQAFVTGQDIHTNTAARLFDVLPDQVTHEQRQLGKRINFSILYGLTPFGLSQDIGIPVKEAKIYIEKYFAQYPAVSTWMEQTIDFCKKNGYVQTWWGRRRYVPSIHEKNKSLYEKARRTAINTVAQGTAADIMKIGMIALDKEFERQKLDASIILQIHDELVIAARKDQADQVQRLVKETLELVVSWSVPLEVTVRIGSSWKEVSK